MGNVGRGRGGTGGGKHLNLETYEVIEAPVDSRPRAHLVPERGGGGSVPSALERSVLVGRHPSSRHPRA